MFRNSRRHIALLILSTLALGGCRMTQRLANRAATQMMTDLVVAMQAHPDPATVEAGLPAYLLLLDAMVAGDPENPDLLQAAASAYTTYAQAFLTRDADSTRAIRLYARARDYGMRLLSRYDFFARTVDGPVDTYERALRQFTVADVAAVHTTAAAWLGWVIADADSMAALAQLGKALALMQRVLELNEAYGNGQAHLVFAVYYAVQPLGAGQDLARSREHFQRAIELAGPDNWLPRVMYAEFIGKATLDEEFFTAELEAVLALDPAAHPAARLLNQLAQDRARTLLATREDYF